MTVRAVVRAEYLEGLAFGRDSDAWVTAHTELSRLARRRGQADVEEGRWLLAAARESVHRHLGFGSFFEYVESLFGYKPRSLEEKLRVAEALEKLPKLREGLQAGTLSWSAARELTRVVTPETETAWCEAIRNLNLRRIEQLVSGRKAGDGPEAPADPQLQRHVLSFEVSPETLATYREAADRLRAESGGRLDEETVLLLMARQALEGPNDSGRSSYQVAFTLCEGCGRGFQHGRGGPFEVGAEVVEMAACDAQSIGTVNSPGPRVASTAPLATPSPAGVALPAARTVPTDPSLDAGAHVGARTPVQALRERARQSVPLATRRLVLHRDGGQCVVPGCCQSVFVDIHHLTLRSEGGGHRAEELIVLCAAHHRALHRGQLILEGSVAGSLVFRHADGSIYRSPLSAAEAAAQTRAFGALRRLGFREGEVRRALDRLRQNSPDASADSASVVRAALRLLTQAAADGS